MRCMKLLAGFAVLSFAIAGLVFGQADEKAVKAKIEEIQQAIKAAGAQWTAGDTPLLHLSDAELKARLMDPKYVFDVNYKGPVFEYTGQALRGAIDWRNYSGKK